MPDDLRSQTPAIAEARSRARRLAHGFIAVVAVLFIGVSTIQIIEAVFGADAAASAGAGPTPCALGVSRLARAFDRDPHDPAAEASPWTQAGAIAEACATTREGLDTWAALERLRLAREQLARSDRLDLEPLRRDVSAHLPADLR